MAPTESSAFMPCAICGTRNAIHSLNCPNGERIKSADVWAGDPAAIEQQATAACSQYDSGAASASETFHAKPADEHPSILTEAQGLVHGARNESYGHPLDDFSRTAGMLNALLAHKLRVDLAPEDVGLIMCCVKLSREANRPKRDNLVGLAGYAETIEWCKDERARREALTETFGPIDEVENL